MWKWYVIVCYNNLHSNNDCFDLLDEIFDLSSTTPEPPGLRYDLEFKIIDLGENFAAPRKGTPDYETLSNSIGDSFVPLFRKIPGYKKIIIKDLKGYETSYKIQRKLLLNWMFCRDKNNVIASMDLLLDKSVVEKGRSLADPDQSQLLNKEVYKTLQDSVNSGRVGNLKLDRSYFVFEPQSCKN